MEKQKTSMTLPDHFIFPGYPGISNPVEEPVLQWQRCLSIFFFIFLGISEFIRQKHQTHITYIVCFTLAKCLFLINSIATFPFVLVHVCVHIYIISRQTWRYEVFPFMHIHIRHPFGLLLGAIQTDDAYISWPGLWQGPTNNVHI